MPTQDERRAMIDKIRRLPEQIEALVSDLTEEQLTTHFLENEWTVAQNVHHLGDSHMNSFIRFKLVLTEDYPTLKGYDQELWAETPEATRAALDHSLLLLKGLHARWVILFESLREEDWSRKGLHSESGDMSIDDILKIYSDHGEAHIDQITRTLAAQ